MFSRSSLVVVLGAVAAVACSKTDSQPISDMDDDVDDAGRTVVDADLASIPALESCPADGSDEAGPKLRWTAGDELDRTVHIIVTMKDELPPVPDCADGGCPERDDFLITRLELATKRMDCVWEFAGGVGNRKHWWYEAPALLSTGEAVAAATAFSFVTSGRESERVATHPFVLGVSKAPRLFADVDCPSAEGDGAAKVVGDVEGEGPFLGIISLEVPEACAGCREQVDVYRHIVATRNLTCVFQRIEEQTGAFDRFSVAGIEVRENRRTWVTSIAGPTRRDEAVAIAELPFVRSIELVDTELPMDPVFQDETHEGPCPTEEEPVEAKLGSNAEEASMLGGPLEVGVVVRGGGDQRRLDVLCPQNRNIPCPEREAARMAVEEANLASQRCVRQRIEEVGGTVTETLGSGNILLTRLTWEQIQKVAAHPHVQSMSITTPSSFTPPP